MDAEVFWKKVKMKLAELGKNQEWLCSKTGILIGSLRNKIHLGRLPSLEEGIKIIDAFGMTMEEFRAYPELPAKDIINIPVYEQAFSAGHGQFVPDNAEILEYVALPSELKKYKDSIHAAYVRGDSMQPTLFDGDIILFDTFGFDGDGVYAILYKGSGFVKRLQKTGTMLSIISDNQIYKPMEEPGQSQDFRIFGKVRYVVHKF